MVSEKISLVFDGRVTLLLAAWAPYFDNMDAIIFLAPISCFDQVRIRFLLPLMSMLIALRCLKKTQTSTVWYVLCSIIQVVPAQHLLK